MRKIIKKLLFCSQYDKNNTIILTSSPRSGSTWLAQAWQELGYDLLDEPLRLSAYPDAEDAGFEWRTYISPNKGSTEQLKYMDNILMGNKGYVRLAKDYFGTVPKPKIFKRCSLVVKFVRANRMLGWITKQFPIQGAILLIRHPCAVVSSQIAMGERDDSPWKYAVKDRKRNVKYLWGGTIPSFIQERYGVVFDKVTSRAGYLTAVWALDNIIPLFIHPPINTSIVYYEHLVQNPIREFTRICKELGISDNIKLPRNWSKPSLTASPDFRTSNYIDQISKWKNQLSLHEINEILSIIEEFGMNIYTDDTMPNTTFLKNK